MMIELTSEQEKDLPENVAQIRDFWRETQK